MKIFNVLSKSLLLGTSVINYFQDGQTKAQEINPPQVTRDISEDNYYKGVYSIKEERVEQITGDRINSTWVITYTLKYNGDKEITLYPSDIGIEYSGTNLSNSRHKSHSMPRTTDPKQVPYEIERTVIFPTLAPASLFTFPTSIKVLEIRYRTSHAEPTRPIRFKLSETKEAYAPVIPSSMDRERCREKISVQVKEYDPYKSGGVEDRSTFPIYSDLRALELLKLKPGSTCQIVLKIEHDHFLDGKYDPLLGDREIEITLGKNKIISSLSLNKEVNPAKVIPELNTPPKERIFNTDDYQRTDRKTIAGREGKFLYLAADITGYQYFRFDDMPIKAGDKFKLSFDYCVAAGSEGNCHVRVMEYKDTPNAWYRLDGGFDAILGHNSDAIYVDLEEIIEDNKENDKESKIVKRNQHKKDKDSLFKRLNGNKYNLVFRKPCSSIPNYDGRWKRFECELDTLPDTTTFALDFRLVGANVGEVWIDIDKLKLENLSCKDL